MRGALLVATLVACGTDTEPTTTESGDSGTPPAGAPTFGEIKAEILTPSCAQSLCHATETDGAANGFYLPDGGEWEAIVDVPSAVLPEQKLVIPGDADGSYLILKLEDAIGIVGSPMPPPIGNLPPDKIEMFRQWIDAGAAND